MSGPFMPSLVLVEAGCLAKPLAWKQWEIRGTKRKESLTWAPPPKTMVLPGGPVPPSAGLSPQTMAYVFKALFLSQGPWLVSWEGAWGGGCPGGGDLDRPVHLWGWEESGEGEEVALEARVSWGGKILGSLSLLVTRFWGALVESMDRLILREFCSYLFAIYNRPSFKKIPTLVCVMRWSKFYSP